MHDEVKAALRTAIANVAPGLQQRLGQMNEPHLVWHRQGQQWQGEYQDRPSLLTLAVHQPLDQASRDLMRVFLQHYPHFNGMVGFASFGTGNFSAMPTNLLSTMFSHMLHRYGTFVCDPAQMDAIIAEVAAFADQPMMQFRFTAQLLNFRMNADEICLPEGLRICRLTDEEVNAIYGGPMSRAPNEQPRRHV